MKVQIIGLSRSHFRLWKSKTSDDISPNSKLSLVVHLSPLVLTFSSLIWSPSAPTIHHNNESSDERAVYSWGDCQDMLRREVHLLGLRFKHCQPKNITIGQFSKLSGCLPKIIGGLQGKHSNIVHHRVVGVYGLGRCPHI